MKHPIYLLLILYNVTNCLGQKKYPTTYFKPPLKIPVLISGTFGEPRPSHLHSGIDIKTQGKQGLAIYAPADGYVSRIKITQYGYGKALYLRHPNGYTTVYAHLSRYNKDIEEYVKKIQYQKQRYIVGNLYPKPKLFPVKKGQLIAYTGNTGGSYGPHLHYEIRDTKTAHIINPMCFGLMPSDVKAPIFKKLLVYPLGANSKVNTSSKKILIPLKKIDKNTYIASNINASGIIGFGVQVFDRVSGTSNKNGIYSLEMKVNGSRVCFYNLKTFSFEDSKYVNLLIDYPYYINYHNEIQKIFRVRGNKLSIYKDLINNGKLVVNHKDSYHIKIIAKDFKGNTAILTTTVLGVKSSPVSKKIDTTAYKITANKFAKFQLKKVTVAFPKNTFYNNHYLNFKVTKGIAHIGKHTIPIGKKFTLTFGISKYLEEEKKHLYIVNINNKKHPKYQKSIKKGDKIYTSTKILGDYTLRTDSIKPTITLLNFKDGQWISKLKTLQVKISDDDSRIKSYRATIDGNWILMEYDHKTQRLFYNFSDKKWADGKHLFTLVVTDNVGNTKNISAIFYRKN